MVKEKTKSAEADFLIIGAGIIGLAFAWNLKGFYPDKKVVIIEKEKDLGQHSSGRNSGVLHAGFYYMPDSLKARFTRQGNAELTKFCEEKGLKINKCGKVIVTKSEHELETLYELKSRGDRNGVELYVIDEKQLKDIEPNAKTYQLALWSPTTSTVDPLEVLHTLKKDLEDLEVEFYFNTPYKQRLDDNTVLAGDKVFSSEKIINAAGLYADKIARDFGFGYHYVIMPFKGLYIEHTGTERFIKTNIYPVPNIKNPFLGVHFTIKVDGTIKIGPTAIPCLWRENYSGLSRFRIDELFEILKWQTFLFFKNPEFRFLAYDEVKKYYRSYLVGEASKLVNYIPKNGFNKWGKPGIRAQVLNIKTLQLENDFVVEGDKNSVHILNAVSPAFTSSFPFTRHIVEKYI